MRVLAEVQRSLLHNQTHIPPIANVHPLQDEVWVPALWYSSLILTVLCTLVVLLIKNWLMGCTLGYYASWGADGPGALPWGPREGVGGGVGNGMTGIGMGVNGNGTADSNPDGNLVPGYAGLPGYRGKHRNAHQGMHGHAGGNHNNSSNRNNRLGSATVTEKGVAEAEREAIVRIARRWEAYKRFRIERKAALAKTESVRRGLVVLLVGSVGMFMAGIVGKVWTIISMALR